MTVIRKNLEDGFKGILMKVGRELKMEKRRLLVDFLSAEDLTSGNLRQWNWKLTSFNPLN